MTNTKTYYNRYLNKVMQEVTKEIKEKGLAPQLTPLFIRRRMKHYGIYSKYLPPDLKPSVVEPQSPESNNEIARVETSSS